MTACKRSCLGPSSVVKSYIEQERQGPEASLIGEVSVSGKANCMSRNELELIPSSRRSCNQQESRF